MRVCMCVFNSGMNLILIPPTLGMGNSCLNELNSGFKIASICSPSEPAPSEATLRLGAHSSRDPGCGSGDGTEHGADRSKVQVQNCPACRRASYLPPGLSAASSVEMGCLLIRAVPCAGTRSTAVGGSGWSHEDDRP